MVSLADSAQAHPARLRQVTEQLLREGRYREGFELFENRPTRVNSPARRLPFPEWRGEPLAGKSIVVWGEQGHGDEIQMIRFLPRVRALGAAKVVLGCMPGLMHLFRGMGAHVICNRVADIVLPDFDYWVGLLSLPHRFDVTAEQISGEPYLRRPWLARTGGIGLVWRGNPNNRTDATRSLPDPELLAGIPGGIFLEPAGDFAESARQLAALDGLITVDTSWAHLAGAIGVRCAVLLAHGEAADWRWGCAERTPWYQSVSLHRQPTPGDWNGAIQSALAGLSGVAPE